MLKERAFADLHNELDTTRRVLERVPEEHFPWKPHERSMALGALAVHMVNLLRWQVMTIQGDHYDLATAPPPGQLPESHDALMASFDEQRRALEVAMGGLTDQQLGEAWQLRHGDQVIFELPRGGVMRTMNVSHLIHHRGQMTVYLRLLDIPVPSVYGPSADESPF